MFTWNRAVHLGLSAFGAVLLLGVSECPNLPGPGPDEPPDPTPQTCEQHCQQEADLTFDQCVASGLPEPECVREAEQAFEVCYAPCSDEATPGMEPTPRPEPTPWPEPTPPYPDGDPTPGDQPPPDTDCVASCDWQAHQIFEDCLAAGGDDRSCTERAQSYFEGCAQGCDNAPPDQPPTDEPPTDSDTCITRCDAQAQQIFDDCIDSGADPARCEQRAAESYASCSEASCPPPPPSADCHEACLLDNEQQYRECVASGRDEAMCAQMSEAQLEACFTGCDAPPQPEPTDCAASCDQRAEQALRDCLDSGSEPERCEAYARQVYDDCVTAHCDTQPPPESTCDQRCADQARMELEACLESGNSPDRCEAWANDLYNSCVQTNCQATPPEPQPEPGCADRCETVAHDTYDQCLAEGGSPERCRQRASNSYDSCVSAHCSGQSR